MYLNIPLYQYISYTQYTCYSVNNATIFITSLFHDMFRPQTAIIRYFSHAKTVPLYRMSTYLHHIDVIIDNLVMKLINANQITDYNIKYFKS
jgi:hypothetical protein